MSTTSRPLSVGQLPEQEALPVAADRSALSTARGSRRPSLGVVLAGLWLATIVLLALTADLLPLKSVGVPAGPPHMTPSLRLPEPLGTDDFGRSQLSRVIYGARVSLSVGVLSTLFGLLVGGAIGTVAGYFRGRVDAAVSLLVDASLAFPALVLLLALAATFTPSVPMLAISIGILVVPRVARLARAHTIRIAGREFVTAARLMGAGHRRILLREIAANTLAPLVAYAFLIVATVIVIEGSLSFLGLGIPPPQPSWGGMINDGRDSLTTDPWIAFVPAIALLLTVLSLNVLGEHARQRWDPGRGGRP
jgi:peptide/nickel transport system permease protein